MRQLLDTHIFLWYLFDPNKLNKRHQQLLSESNHIYISATSFWEIAIKFALGKLNLQGHTPDELPTVAARYNIFQITPLIETFASIHQLPMTKHCDPFDRLITWQAIRENFVLVTEDEAFAGYENFGLKIYKN